MGNLSGVGTFDLLEPGRDPFSVEHDTANWQAVAAYLSTHQGFRPKAPNQALSLFGGSQLIGQLQAGHGWTVSASLTQAQDAVDFVRGTSAVKLTTDGTGATRSYTRTATTAIDNTAKHVTLLVKVDDTTKLAGLNFFLGDDTFTNFWKWSIQTAPIGSNLINSGEWVRIKLHFADATVTGAPLRASTATAARLQIVDAGTGPVNVWFNECALVPQSSQYANGVVSITFDDNFAGAYNLGAPLLDAQGWAASLYVIADMVGKSGRMTLQQIQNLHNAKGWEVAGHAFYDANHGAQYDQLSLTVVEDDIVRMRRWLIDNGFRGSHGYAYPKGGYTPAVQALLAKYASYGLTTINKTKECYPVEPGQLYKLRRISGITAFAGGFTIANTTTAITNNKNEKGWLILNFHDITAGAGTTTTECQQSDLQTIITAIVSAGSTVLPVADVLAAM